MLGPRSAEEEEEEEDEQATAAAGSTTGRRGGLVSRQWFPGFPGDHPRLVAVVGWREATLCLKLCHCRARPGVIATELRHGFARPRPQVACVVDDALHG